MPQMPITRKQDFVEHQQAFICTNAHPFIATRTTGTTGRPAEIWLSKYESELWAGLSTLSGLLRNEIHPEDLMQINISSRATAAVQTSVTVCRLAGARVRVLGTIPPEESLDNLIGNGEEAPSLLSTYPSYLAMLVKAAQQRGLTPHDFRLRRIDCGGEILSNSLAQAAREVFGARINDTFGMTEVLPVSGRICSQQHLHLDPNMGFIEILDLETGQPSAPGALGTVVITPYYPYRECMPVFRYDTRDVVRKLADEALTCEVAGIPATSLILGKADHLLYIDKHMVTPRDIVEIYEALPSQPWPARFKLQRVDKHIELVMPEEVLRDVSKEEVERRFRAEGIDLTVVSNVGSKQDVTALRPLRAYAASRRAARRAPRRRPPPARSP